MTMMATTATNKPEPVQQALPGVSEPVSIPMKMPVLPDRLYFKIGDVAELADLKPYVLRFWETEFPIISPQKGTNGQRVYRRSDVETILMIKHLLYVERYSIEGAKKRINELRYQGELKTFKKEVTTPPRDAQLEKKLDRVQGLVRDLRHLQQLPVSKLFNY